MFVHEAPFLGAVNGAAKLRHEAVRLQCYADVNPGSQPDVLAFWEAQKALADVDHGLPYDGTWVPGALDLRPSCFKVLSHYRLFNTAGLVDYKAFCQFFIEKNGGSPEVPLAFTTNLAPTLVLETGQQLGLSVAVAGGTAPYKYQWKRNGSAIGSDKPTYGPTSAVAGTYTCTVTDAKGVVIVSVECVVTINPPAE